MIDPHCATRVVVVVVVRFGSVRSVMSPPFLGLRAPTPADVAAACDHGRARGYNYPSALVGTSDRDETRERTQRARLEADGKHRWAVDRTRARVGRGRECYERAERALRGWEHFQLGWATVDETSGTKAGDAVCVVARVAGVWIRNPLRVVAFRKREREEEEVRRVGTVERFSFAHGTLGGHLLAGEERFAVELTEDGDVFYEAYAFSRPAHALSVIGYPFVRLLQKRCHWDSMRRMRKILAAESGGQLAMK